MEKEFPQLVHTDDLGCKAIAYDRLSVVLLEAIKLQQKKIDEMEARLKALEAK